MRKTPGYLIPVLVLLVLKACDLTPETALRFEGTVSASIDSTAIPGAEVKLSRAHLTSVTVLKTVLTDENGCYVLEYMDDDCQLLNLSASAEGYQRASYSHYDPV